MTDPNEIISRERDREGAVAPLLKAVRAYKWMVILTVVAAIGGAIAYLAIRDLDYEADAAILISPVSADDPTLLGLNVLRDSGDPARTAQTAAELLTTLDAAERTSMTLGEDEWPLKRVRDRIEVEPKGESDIISVIGTANDPTEAARLATVYARMALTSRKAQLRPEVNLARKRLRAEVAALPPGDPTAPALNARLTQLETILDSGDPTIRLQEAAAKPRSAINPSAVIALPLALLAGLALGSGAALLREFTDRRVRSLDEARVIYPLSVLTRVPMLSKKAMQKPDGATWMVPPQLREAYLSVSLQLEERGHPMGAVMVTSPTRGDGKTTSAINLAVTLAAAGKRVILMDFDFRNPNISGALDLTENAHPASAILDSDIGLPDLLVNTPLDRLRTLVVQPAPGDAASAELISRRLPEFISEGRAIADHVVIDTPPLGEISDALRLAGHVDDILVVLRPGSTQRAHLTAVRDLLGRVGQKPEGFIVIGDPDGADGAGYKGYGYGAAATTGLVVGGEDPVGAPLDA